MYDSRGIHIHNLNTDNEFECIKDDILPVQLNVVTGENHVGDVERFIRTVKEGTRCDIQRLSYTQYPRAMVRGCAIKRANDLNQLPSTYGISTDLSPTILLTEKPSPDFLQVTKLNFGDYEHAYNVSNITNTPKSRGVGSVSLYSSGNETGG